MTLFLGHPLFIMMLMIIGFCHRGPVGSVLSQFINILTIDKKVDCMRTCEHMSQWICTTFNDVCFFGSTLILYAWMHIMIEYCQAQAPALLSALVSFNFI